MHSKTRQRGASLWGILFLLAIFGFGAVIGLKLVPVYLESYKIDKAMAGVLSDPRVANQTERDIVIALSKRLDIDGITRITDLNFREYGTITKRNKVVNMEIDYQAEVPLFGNLTLLADFEKAASSVN